MYVWFDGKANPCDSDYKSYLSYGNVKDATVKEIWADEKLKKLQAKTIKFLKPFDVVTPKLFSSVIINTPAEIKQFFRRSKSYDGNFAILLDSDNKIWFMYMNLIQKLLSPISS